MTDVPIIVSVDSTKAQQGSKVVVRSLDDIEKKAKATDTATGRLGVNASKNIDKINKSVGGLSSSFKLLTTVVASVGIVRLGSQMVQAASDMQQLNARLLATTGSLNNAVEAMGFLRSAAARQSVDLIDLANGYTRLLPAVDSGKISMDQMRQILSLTNDNIKAFGLSTSETQAIFLGLSQTLTSGTITMEDMRQVTDRLPGSFDRMAKSLGLTTAEFRKTISTGEVVIEDVLPAMIDAFARNEGAAESMATTFQSSVVRINNATRDLGQAITDIESLGKAAAFAGDLIQGIADDINFANQAFDNLSTERLQEQLITMQSTLTKIIKDRKELDDSFFNFRPQPLLSDEVIDGQIDYIEKLREEIEQRKILQEVTKEREATIKKESLTLAELVKNMEFELKVSRLTDRQKEIEVAKRKAIKTIMKEHSLTQKEVIERYKQEIDQVTGIAGKLADEEAARKSLEKATKDAEQTAKEAMDEMARQAEQAAERIQDSLADSIGDIIRNFDDLESVGERVFNNIKNFAIDSFSQIAARDILGGSSLGVSGVSGVSGGSVSNGVSLLSGLGGFGSSIDAIGASIGFGAGSSVVGATGPLLPAASAGLLTSASLSSVLGAAGIGAFGGNIVAGLTGGNTTGGTIGGGLGGVAGSLILPGLGTAIGTAIGGAIGGLFGPGVGTVASEFAGTTSSKGISSTFGSKRSSTEFAQGVSSAIGAIVSGVGNLSGVNLSGQNLRGGSNTNQFGGGFLDINGQIIKFNAESEESLNNALAKATVAMVKFGDVTNKSVLTAIDNITTEGRTLEEVISDIEFAASFDKLFEVAPTFTAMELAVKNLDEQFNIAIETANRLGLSEQKLTDARDNAVNKLAKDFNESIQDQILGITDPIALQLKQLDEQKELTLRDAKAIGADTVAVEKLFALERKRILEDTAEDLSKYLDTITRIQDKLSFSATLSGTNAQGRALEADKQLQTLAGRVSSGDTSVFNDLDRVVNSSLQASLDYYGSTGSYLERLSKVNTILDASRGLASGETSQSFDASLGKYAQQSSEETSYLGGILQNILTEMQDLNDSITIGGVQ